jgi:hypothetical protein
MVSANGLVGLRHLDHRQLTTLGVEAVALAVKSFSFSSMVRRAAVHSSCETTFGKLIRASLRVAYSALPVPTFRHTRTHRCSAR